MSIRSKQILLMLAIALLPVALSGWQSYRQISQMAADMAETAGRQELLRDRHFLREKVADVGMGLDLTGALTEQLLERQADTLVAALSKAPPADARAILFSRELSGKREMQPSFLLAEQGCDSSCQDRLQQLNAATSELQSIYEDAGSLSLWHYAGFADGISLAFPGHGNYPEEYDPRDRPWYEVAAGRGGPTWLPLTVDASTGQPVLTLAQTLRDAEGNFLGVTAIDLPLARLLSFETEAAPWLSSAELAILREGEPGRIDVVAKQRALDMDSNWQSEGQRRRLDGFNNEQLDQLRELRRGDRMLIEDFDIDGEWHNIALTQLGREGNTWLALMAPHSATEAAIAAAVDPILAARAESLRHHALGALALALLAAIIAIVAANRVTQPLIQMSRTAELLADGKLESRTGLQRSDEVGTLSASIDRMADSIEQLQLEQEQAYRDMIMALHRALEKKDSYTAGHSGRVMRTSLKLGQRIGLDEATMEILRFGALTHDLGKIGIADAILNKPAPLVGEEIEIMRQHPTFSKTIMKPLVRFQEYAEIAGSHHEHWDGGGYPDGLKGEEIHLLARIVAIADAWDSMIGDRVYRKGMPVAQALDILEREQEDGQFDPTLLREFIAMVRAEQSGSGKPAARQA